MIGNPSNMWLPSACLLALLACATGLLLPTPPTSSGPIPPTISTLNHNLLEELRLTSFESSSNMFLSDDALLRSSHSVADDEGKSAATTIGEVITFGYLGASIIAGAYGVYSTSQRNKKK